MRSDVDDDVKLWKCILPMAIISYFAPLIQYQDIQESFQLAKYLPIIYAVLSIALFVPSYLLTKIRAVNISIIVVLALWAPCIVGKAIYPKARNGYLYAWPKDGYITFKITADPKITKWGNIGNDLKFHHYINGNEFWSGNTVRKRVGETLTFETEIVEADSIPDIGSAYSVPFRYSDSYHYEFPNLYLRTYVTVDEKGGNYISRGESAEFETTYCLTRVMPAGTRYVDILTYITGTTAYWVLQASLWFQFATVGFVILEVLILLHSTTSERRESRKKNREIREQYRSEKERFAEAVEAAGGLRKYAGVPDNVRFVDGLPVDGDGQEFGSYTVYTAMHGNCYHKYAGCCSAKFPKHIFEIGNRYHPCKKCCPSDLVIPDWYRSYKLANRLAVHYKCKFKD